MVECLTQDRRAVGSSLTSVTALWSLSTSLVLVQPRKIRPYITERLLMGRKDQIKQTNKTRPNSALDLRRWCTSSICEQSLCKV